MEDFAGLATLVSNSSADVCGRVLDISYPPAGRIRSRKVVCRSQAKSTFKHPSWKLGRMVEAESSYERDGFQLLDADPTVASYREQPLKIIYEINGEIHRHYPDVLIRRNGSVSKELWEIKSRMDHMNPSVLIRTTFLQMALRDYGFLYRPIVAEDLAIEPRLSNARKLLRYGHRPVDPRSREHVRLLLKSGGAIHWAVATNGDLGANGCSALCRLALEGAVHFDFQHELTLNSAFRWGDAKGWGL